MKKIVYFCKNNNIEYRILSNGILISKKFILVEESAGNFSSNMKFYKINSTDHKTWISIISRELNLKLGLKILKILKSFKNEYEYSITDLRDCWGIISSGSTWGESKLIKHFHKSLLESHCNKMPSPRVFLSNKKNILKIILNRMIYTNKLTNNSILDGITISKMNPRVSVFAPSLAKHILSTYASDAQTVLDPFSGFSGRMLGTLASGKRYIGSDLRSDVISESQAICNFLNQSADLSVSDFKNRMNVSADVLFTCPPYGSKEFWPGVTDYYTEDYYIDWILKNFQCKKYIFVVKNTNHTKNIVTTIRNGSWIKSLHHEKILIF